MKLTTTDELFIAEYIKNGGNGTKAYLAIRPGVAPRSAAVCANILGRHTPGGGNGAVYWRSLFK